MNKKFKSILCGAMAFVAGSVVLSACGAKTKTDEPTEQEQQQETTVETKSTISLEQAEKIILQALAIKSETTVSTAAETETNRDVMEKFGRFKVNRQMVYTEIADATKVQKANSNALVTYQNHQIDAISIEETDKLIYSPDREHCYQYNVANEECVAINGYATELRSEFEANYEGFLLKNAFNDEAFGGLYHNDVIKETNAAGYSLTLHATDVKTYYYYKLLWFSRMEPGDAFDTYFAKQWQPYEAAFQTLPQELVDSFYWQVTVNFDKDDAIISAVIDEFGATQQNGTNVTCAAIYEYTSTDAEIKTPDWVIAYQTAQGE